MAVVADLAPPHLRGRYQGVFGLAFGVAGALAPFLGTRVLTAFGSSALWAGCAAVSAVAAVGLLVAVRAAQRREPGAGPAPARAGGIGAQP
jgi:MFS family permease